ncbi:MAG TPA: NAD-dependent epimerase/dehydratase family protein [Vicinamibacterales bacterium]|nr:NAD-dependent epimerase/dehydratase family protein [Vicinamibacterales bacterium]
MVVLVTGGTGYLGRAIVAALWRRGHEPVVFARHASGSGVDARTIDGDVRDTPAVVRAAEGVAAICHAAALVSVWRRDASAFDAVNVGGLQSVMAAARALHVPRVVYTSSFLALPPADSPQTLTANPYQRTKVLARDVARRAAADGLPIVTLYPGVIYGPGLDTEGNLVGRFLRDHLAGRLPGVIGADHRWSYAYIDDVAEAHVRALTLPQGAAEYVIGGVNAPQIALFAFLERTRGTPLPRRIPYAVASLAALADEARATLFGTPPRITRGIVEIFRHDWTLDSTAAVAQLDYAITPLEEGLTRTLAALS